MPGVVTYYSPWLLDYGRGVVPGVKVLLAPRLILLVSSPPPLSAGSQGVVTGPRCRELRRTVGQHYPQGMVTANIVILIYMVPRRVVLTYRSVVVYQKK